MHRFSRHVRWLIGPVMVLMFGMAQGSLTGQSEIVDQRVVLNERLFEISRGFDQAARHLASQPPDRGLSCDDRSWVNLKGVIVDLGRQIDHLSVLDDPDVQQEARIFWARSSELLELLRAETAGRLHAFGCQSHARDVKPADPATFTSHDHLSEDGLTAHKLVEDFASVQNPNPQIPYLHESLAAVRDLAAERNVNLLDASRLYVFENSRHGDGDWYVRHANDVTYVLEMLYKTSIGLPDAELPELLCGNYENVLGTLLQAMGFSTRTVYLYSDIHTGVLGHVVLEVLNPVTGNWEVHDADYNLYYVDIQTGRRASILELLTTPNLARFAPCDSKYCGWFAARGNGLFAPSALFLAGYFSAGEIPAQGIAVVNYARRARDRRFPDNDNVTFATFIQDQVRQRRGFYGLDLIELP